MLPSVGERVGFQNPVMAPELRFQAAVSYSSLRAPRIGRRRILPWTGSGTGRVLLARSSEVSGPGG